ncbi:hypothetical protein FHS04_001558 [Mesoflavibacter sabulilitoris]|uniref:DUF4260 domain-containing protein n=1 Tax=Mesoflavibacter zeaxanthinifaciens subsp. sabulilitoris TaxID=1520893 RepID=A0A2T1N7D8_9FLAO|nr:DUF4260 domain-containing protein [Mesoflavibacter zeaxanthinifaciens]MBB3124049.1 hypothetical protein [Mesoflavibacter zeaxanthinifaciens subsp. sabulilitoris]PSG87777.1 DUF4260 domain-containing protein [Mesoflavibacter zeaxanthinifaciens subsp. sabulilitoris]
MKSVLKLEELLQFALGIYLFSTLSYTWWWFLVLILLPDIGMLGYLINTKTGALTYNVFHHKGLAILIFLVGIYFEIEVVQLTGIILFSHASLDRIFGYGLKYADHFKNTHLGHL